MNERSAEIAIGPIRFILRSTLIWAVSLAAIVFVTISVWPAFKGGSGISQAIDQLPAGVVHAFGLESFGTPAGFLRGNLYAFFVPLLLGAAGLGFVNSLTSGEEDGGRLEIILAQPVSRQAVFLGRSMAAALSLLAVLIATSAVQFGSDALFGLQIGADRLLAVLVLSGLLALFHAGLAIALAGLSGKPSLVLGVGFFVLIAGCVAASLFPLTNDLADLAHLSPWDWAFSGDPLVNGAEPWRYLALGGPAVLMATLGTWAFGRRDVSAA